MQTALESEEDMVRFKKKRRDIQTIELYTDHTGNLHLHNHKKFGSPQDDFRAET